MPALAAPFMLLPPERSHASVEVVNSARCRLLPPESVAVRMVWFLKSEMIPLDPPERSITEMDGMEMVIVAAEGGDDLAVGTEGGIE